MCNPDKTRWKKYTQKANPGNKQFQHWLLWSSWGGEELVAVLFTLQVCAGLSETHRLCSVKVRDVLVLPQPHSPHTCVPVTPHVCPCAQVLPLGLLQTLRYWGFGAPAQPCFPLLP